MISPSESKGALAIPKPVFVLGVPIVPFESYSSAVKCVEEAIKTGRKSFWVAVNPEKIYRAIREPKLRSLFNEADVCICDGVGVSVASKILHNHFLPRCTGCDLFFELLATAEQKSWRVFLLGASSESNEKASLRLQQELPELRIVGTQDGYFEDSAMVVEQINASGADLLFVAMGSPKQEYWIFEHRDAINASFCMGVGGSFNIASGMAKRAPKVFRKIGMEFFYQLVTEPKRIKSKIVYGAYMLRVIKEKLLGPSRSAGPPRP